MARLVDEIAALDIPRKKAAKALKIILDSLDADVDFPSPPGVNNNELDFGETWKSRLEQPLKL